MKVLADSSVSIQSPTDTSMPSSNWWWIFALQDDDGKRYLSLTGLDAMEAAQFRASAGLMLADEAPGALYAEDQIVSVSKATRIWGPNLILNVSISSSTFHIYQVSGPRGALKTLFATLGHPL